jgi:hypothetical protein
VGGTSSATQPLPGCRVVQSKVEGSEEVLADTGPRLEGGRELHGIVPAERTALGENSRTMHHRLAAIHDVVSAPVVF